MSMPDIIMLAPSLSPFLAAVGRLVNCALAHFNPSSCGGVVALLGAHGRLRGSVLLMAGDAAAGDLVVVSPVPPSRESRPGAFGQALEAKGAHRFFQWGCTRSAGNPWKSTMCRAKSLILEAMQSTTCPRFSTGYGGFSTGRVLAAHSAFPSLSPSKSLNEKRKEQGGRQAERTLSNPRVAGLFPQVQAPAYFLIHGFHRSESANLWKVVEEKDRKINGLCLRKHESTDPQIALRVVPSRGMKWEGYDAKQHDDRPLRRCQAARRTPRNRAAQGQGWRAARPQSRQAMDVFDHCPRTLPRRRMGPASCAGRTGKGR